jgi:peptidoglycan/xylan/chitin deacetylase (PgdA/CDA1 family)
MDAATATGSSTIALMYHALGEAAGPAADAHYTVATARFQEQLGLCARLGGAAVSARDWLAGRAGVILTFDDGHETNYHLGFPALVAAGAGADFFVNPAQVGTPGFASWTQLREMADAGMSIQSHGLDHRYFLTELTPQRLREELRRARLEIEEHVGRPVTLLAPPGGRSPARLQQIAEEVGYTHVLDSRPGPVRRAAGRRTLCRLAVTAQLELPTLESWLRGGRALRRAQLRYAALDLAKRLVGDQAYQSIRRRLLGTAVP